MPRIDDGGGAEGAAGGLSSGAGGKNCTAAVPTPRSSSERHVIAREGVKAPISREWRAWTTAGTAYTQTSDAKAPAKRRASEMVECR